MDTTFLDLYKSDQKSRTDGTASTVTDARIRMQARRLLRSKFLLLSGEEWFYFGHIYHHGDAKRHSLVALAASVLSMVLFYARARNLFALSIDRLCMKIGIRQVFGSQLFKANEHTPWQVYRSLSTNARIRKFFYWDSAVMLMHKNNSQPLQEAG